MASTPQLQASADGWDQYGIFILKELERLNTNYETLRAEVSKIYPEIATLRTKAGLWGAVGAAIPVLLMLAIQLMVQ